MGGREGAAGLLSGQRGVAQQLQQASLSLLRHPELALVRLETAEKRETQNGHDAQTGVTRRRSVAAGEDKPHGGGIAPLGLIRLVCSYVSLTQTTHRTEPRAAAGPFASRH